MGSGIYCWEKVFEIGGGVELMRRIIIMELTAPIEAFKYIKKQIN